MDIDVDTFLRFQVGRWEIPERSRLRPLGNPNNRAGGLELGIVQQATIEYRMVNFVKGCIES